MDDWFDDLTDILPDIFVLEKFYACITDIFHYAPNYTFYTE